jgi:hypothetical protein
LFAVREPEESVPIEPEFAKSWVVEATPEAYRLVVEAEPKMAEVAKRFVEVVLVPVAFVQVRFETASAPPVNVRFAIVALVAPKFVAKRAVEVALVARDVREDTRRRSGGSDRGSVNGSARDRGVGRDQCRSGEGCDVAGVRIDGGSRCGCEAKPGRGGSVSEGEVRDGAVRDDVPLVVKKFVEVVLVPVALVQVMLVGEKFEAERFVKTPFVENRLVVVTLVPVAFVKVRPWREEAPETVRAVMLPVVMVAVPAVTEVALMEPIARFVPVALRKVRSCKEV